MVKKLVLSVSLFSLILLPAFAVNKPSKTVKKFNFIVNDYDAYNCISNAAIIPTGDGYWSISKKEKPTTLLLIIPNPENKKAKK